MENSIDAIFAWVDGNDENHRAKMKPYIENFDSTKFKARYSSINEIEIAVNSIIKFADFIRHIYIVTDAQTPDFYKELQKAPDNPLLEKIKIVDHKDIFKGYEQYLPTFNAISIETLIHRIPGLSEKFIYFNDDIIISKKVKETDFFINDAPLIRGKWTDFYENLTFRRLYKKAKERIGKSVEKQKYGYKLSQQNSAKILGFDKYFRLHHTPMPMRKSTLEKYYSDNPGLLHINLKHKFRGHEQYMIQSFAAHLEIKNQSYVLSNDYKLTHFRSYKRPAQYLKRKLNRALTNKEILFLNIQSLDLAAQEDQDMILKILQEHMKLS